MTKQSSAGLLDEIRLLLDQSKSLVLASTGEGATPLCSYAPYYHENAEHFYIFISTLSAHTGNILANPAVSAMVIEDEANTRQIYARTRLTFSGLAHEVTRHDRTYPPLLAHLQNRHGEIVDTLRELSDFRLIGIAAGSATYVRGFGQAYRVTPGLTAIEPIGP